MIWFNARNRVACCRKDPDPITTGSVGYPVIFSFDKSWDGLIKTAIFRASGKKAKRAIETAEHSIPPEVLTEAGSTLWIGVYGKNSAGTLVMPTVWAKAGTIHAGTDDPEGIDPGGSTYEGPYTVTPTEEQQILETARKNMEQNVIVEQIPLEYAEISAVGSTLFIR